MESKNPSRLSKLWEGWKRVAKKIGDVQARIILTLFYIFIVGPFALAIRWFGDPLAIKERQPAKAGVLGRAMSRFHWSGRSQQF